MHTHSKPRNNSITSTQEKLRAELHQDFPDISKLKAGEKSLFLRNHRELILKYCEVFGETSACIRFHMTADTLVRLHDGSAINQRGIPRKQLVELKADLANERIAALEKRLDHLTLRLENLLAIRKETRELREEFESFTQTIATRFTKTLLLPLLQNLLKEYGGIIPAELDTLDTNAVVKYVNPKKKCLKITTH